MKCVLGSKKQTELFAPPEEDSDCCIIAAHRANERFVPRGLTPAERKEIDEDLEKLGRQPGLSRKKAGDDQG